MAKHRKDVKTNAMRVLDAAEISYEYLSFPCEEALSGVEVAARLALDPHQVFKTLVTQGKSGDHFVFMIPVAEELDLKKAACSVNEKAIHMIKSRELLPLTGYVHGACSPIGMKKQFVTRIDESAQLFDTIMFSGGKFGFQIRMNSDDLQGLVPFEYADLLL